MSGVGEFAQRSCNMHYGSASRRGCVGAGYHVDVGVAQRMLVVTQVDAECANFGADKGRNVVGGSLKTN